MAATIINSLICLINCHNYHLKRLITLSFQYYRLLLVYNAAFTIMVLLFFGFPNPHINAGSFLFAKVIGFTSAIGLYHFMAKESYFYFRNAGYSILRICLNA